MIFHGIAIDIIIKGESMLSKLKNIFKFNKNNHKSDYKLLKDCLENLDINKKDFDTVIVSLYNDIKEYLKALKILEKHDYNKNIDRLKLPKMNEQEIYLKDFITDDNGYVYLDYNILFKELIKTTINLIEIHDILKNSNDPNNFFNLRILEIYITNMKKLVKQLNLC